MTSHPTRGRKARGDSAATSPEPARPASVRAVPKRAPPVAGSGKDAQTATPAPARRDSPGGAPPPANLGESGSPREGSHLPVRSPAGSACPVRSREVTVGGAVWTVHLKGAVTVGSGVGPGAPLLSLAVEAPEGRPNPTHTAYVVAKGLAEVAEDTLVAVIGEALREPEKPKRRRGRRASRRRRSRGHRGW